MQGSTSKGPKVPLWTKVFVGLGLVTVLFSTATYAGMSYLTSRYDGNIRRADLLGGMGGTGKVEGPMNILVLGSDSRATSIYDPGDTSSSLSHVGGARTDALILVHLNRDLSKAWAVSFPRDLYAPLATKDGDLGPKNKLNAAFAFGGARRVVQTFDLAFDIKVDHVVVVDFGAIRKITDAVGGVDVMVEKTVTDPRTRVTFTQGPNHLDGVKAEAFVRQRYKLAEGDFDRQKRQQQYLHALSQRVASAGVLANPVTLDKLLLTATAALTVDKKMPVKGLAFQLKSLKPEDVGYLTVPHDGTPTIPGVGSVVRAAPEATELYLAINTDTLDQYVLKHGANDASRGR
jgi:LCP family protein required for cell wall assembly